MTKPDNYSIRRSKVGEQSTDNVEISRHLRVSIKMNDDVFNYARICIDRMPLSILELTHPAPFRVYKYEGRNQKSSTSYVDWLIRRIS